jgi:septum site-determining protein MinC
VRNHVTAITRTSRSAARASRSFKFRGRSFHALVIKPEVPLSDWLAEAEAWTELSPGFFSEKPVVIDVSGLSLTKRSFVALVEELKNRNIRILGVEGADPTWADVGAPLLITSGHLPISKVTKAPAPPSQSLLIDMPVRSGQSIVHPDGDVTIVGSVASGAEVIAAGSIHIYGTLRGRVLAGAYGNRSARIFCRRLEAELMAINGHYSVADEIEPHLRKTSVHAWLEGDALKIMTMD